MSFLLSLKLLRMLVSVFPKLSIGLRGPGHTVIPLPDTFGSAKDIVFRLLWPLLPPQAEQRR